MIEIRFTTDEETAYQPMSDDVEQMVLKAAETENAEVLDTEHQIMSFLGHANPAMAARYTAAANRGTMAAAGLAKLRTVAGTDLSNLD